MKKDLLLVGCALVFLGASIFHYVNDRKRDEKIEELERKAEAKKATVGPHWVITGKTTYDDVVKIAGEPVTYHEEDGLYEWRPDKFTIYFLGFTDKNICYKKFYLGP